MTHVITALSTGPSVSGFLVPTSVHSMLTDSKTSVVGYTNGSIAQFDYAAERVIQLTRAIDVDSVGRGGQVNKVRPCGYSDVVETVPVVWLQN